MPAPIPPGPYSSSPVTSFAFSSTGSTLTDALLDGVKWGGAVGTGTTIFYSFPGSGSSWNNPGNYRPSPGWDEPYNHFSALNATQQAAAGIALQAWANVADLTLVKVTESASSVGDIRIAFTGGGSMDAGTYAYTYMPVPVDPAALGVLLPADPISGDLWINTLQPVASGSDYATGANGYNTLIHELGHALGLKHPFDTDPVNSVTLTDAFDIFKYTVMSYSDAPGHQDTGSSSYYPTTPMPADILAIQYLYGANMSFHAGDDVYVFSQGQNYYQTIWDAGGNDTLQYNATIGGWIDLNAGNFSRLGNQIRLSDGTMQSDTVAIAYNVVIENATGGSGSDTLIGNDVANRLDGGVGNDTIRGGNGADNLLGGNGNDSLDGGYGADSLLGGAGNDALVGNEGADTMDGGSGNDIYYIYDTSGDMITDSDGYDIVITTVSFDLGTNGAGIEKLVLDGHAPSSGSGNELDNLILGNDAANDLNGGAGNDSISGGAGSDTLTGGTGNDTLDGGAGTNRLYGGEGDDLYLIAGENDVISDTAGKDTVSCGFSFDLSVNATGIENLQLTGGAAIDATGDALDNHIKGNSAGNRLDGGAGSDTLEGGAGDDFYVVDSSADRVVENAGGGVDRVQSAASYTLSANVEVLILTGMEAIRGRGNGSANRITGNAADNVLDGAGGADTLAGGAGDDTYVAGPYAIVVELADGGIDTVLASGSYHLADELENLRLTGLMPGTTGSGNAADNRITGSRSDNTLAGGEGNDMLDGGLGADTLIGGAGNDVYLVNDSGDRVLERMDGGVDTVRSQVSYGLGVTLENLELSGSGNLNGAGNDGANLIRGNSGRNLLSGGAGDDTLYGGAGNDTLAGGAGADRFMFDSLLKPNNVDRIMGFDSGTDRLELSHRVFSGLAPGELPSAGFVAGLRAVASGSEATIVYDTATGGLYYDADGNGVGSMQMFALLNGSPDLAAGDILIV